VCSTDGITLTLFIVKYSAAVLISSVASLLLCEVVGHGTCLCTHVYTCAFLQLAPHASAQLHSMCGLNMVDVCRYNHNYNLGG
jgi:hypothetical protein